MIQILIILNLNLIENILKPIEKLWLHIQPLDNQPPLLLPEQSDEMLSKCIICMLEGEIAELVH